MVCVPCRLYMLHCMETASRLNATCEHLAHATASYRLEITFSVPTSAWKGLKNSQNIWINILVCSCRYENRLRIALTKHVCRRTVLLIRIEIIQEEHFRPLWLLEFRPTTHPSANSRWFWLHRYTRMMHLHTHASCYTFVMLTKWEVVVDAGSRAVMSSACCNFCRPHRWLGITDILFCSSSSLWTSLSVSTCRSCTAMSRWDRCLCI